MSFSFPSCSILTRLRQEMKSKKDRCTELATKVLRRTHTVFYALKRVMEREEQQDGSAIAALRVELETYQRWVPFIPRVTPHHEGLTVSYETYMIASQGSTRNELLAGSWIGTRLFLRNAIAS